MAPTEWWIDGDIGIDAGGTVYATWDTQGTNANGTPNDIAWLSYSSDGGKTWSAPAQAPSDQASVPHIIEVAGASSGIAYVGWLSNSSQGYAQYLRTFSTRWLALGARPDLEPVRQPLGVARGHVRNLDRLAEQGCAQLG